MKQVFAILTCVFANMLAVSLHPSRPRLPQCTSSKSKGNKDIDLQCSLKSGEFLDYNDIRAFTESRPGKPKFNVSIECSDGGFVHLPWPFSAKNVVSLQVSGCGTVGFISEMFDPYPHANQLRQVSIVDAKHRITIKELYNSFFMHDTIPKEYDCGLSNIVVKIFRNIEYTFPAPSGSIDEIIMMEELLSTNSLDKLLAHSSVCTFPYLKYIEESGNSAFSLARFKIMESTGSYPELQYYDLRNNSIHSVPKEFRDLDISFLPKLAVLDLSDNVISAADFVYKGQKPKSLLVDLRRNRIRSLGERVVKDILKGDTIVLDLRENPLVCSCALFTYANHLLSLRGNTVALEIYTGMTCERNNRGVLEIHHVTETGLAKQLCAKA